MKISKDTGRFLTGEDIDGANILVKIAGEGEIENKEFKGRTRTRLMVPVELEDGTEKIAGMNATSRNNIIDYLGDETSKWVGKEVRVWKEFTKIGMDKVTVLVFTSPSKNPFGETYP